MSKKLFNVLCTSVNASALISGIAFKPVTEPEPGMLAEGLTVDEAAKFRGIDGYRILDGDDVKPETAAEKKAREATEARERAARVEAAKVALVKADEADEKAKAARTLADEYADLAEKAEGDAVEGAKKDAAEAEEAAVKAEAEAVTARAEAVAASAAAEQ